MRTLLAFTLLALAFVSNGFNARAQEKSEPRSPAAPQNKLVEFHMAVLKRGPKWSATPGKDAQQIQQEHIAFIQSLLESGKATIAGPVNDDGDVRGIYILRAKSAEEAKAWAMADPAVIGERFIAEMHPWWSEDVIKKANWPLKLSPAYIAFLTRGEKWTPEKSPATEALQAAHIANIQRLAALKKLVVAGPFGDDGKLRGIFVFRVGSLEEAQALTDTDPAVKAGRLSVDIHPWLVPEGTLPE